MSGQHARPADAMPLRAGRRREPYTEVSEWVTYSDTTVQARMLYVILCSHVNHMRAEEGDTAVWPSQRKLADAMKFKQTGSIKRYLKELELLGAVDVERGRNPHNPMLKQNTYIVHETPPPGYRGPRSLAEFHDYR